jgi:hypothetical protein
MSRMNRPTRLVALGLVAALGFLANPMAAKTPPAERASPQQAVPAPSPPSSEAKKQDPGPTMMVQNMIAMRQKMMADNKFADAQLQPLIDKMNAATDSAKVDAMAAVITELVRQRTVARAQMDQMSPMMSPTMMGMMMQGMTADMRTMAAQCPMMKGFGDTPPK